MKQKRIILAAKVMSVVFTPFYLPIVGLACLLVFTYLSLLPLMYKLYLLFAFWLFTVFILVPGCVYVLIALYKMIRR